jgi:hypothetical protein
MLTIQEGHWEQHGIEMTPARSYTNLSRLTPRVAPATHG